MLFSIEQSILAEKTYQIHQSLPLYNNYTSNTILLESHE